MLIRQAVATEMDSRLAAVRIKPQHIVLMGADFFTSPYLLGQRYPKASLLEIEPDLGFLQASQRIGKKSKGLWGAIRGKILSQKQQAFDEALPASSAAMLWSSLNIHAHTDIKASLQNWAQILNTEGMVFMATFGPDSLQELLPLLHEQSISVNREKLWDMHDIGDILLANGFMQAITDMSKLVISYQNPDNFWEDMSTLRLFDAFQIQAPVAHYEKLITEAIAQRQLTHITLEIVYAHALKKPQSRLSEKIVHFHSKKLAQTD